MKDKKMLDWILRFVKGIFIGSGAIIPGVSGGALAAIFGIYERIISFLANLTKDFKKNFLFLFPVGLGAVFGIFLLSIVLSFLLDKSDAQLRWFFIGCIAGTIPALFKQAAKKGRNTVDIIVMVITTIVFLLILYNAESLITGTIDLNFGTWILAGVIFALGLIVPGLSPSNFLMYLNMYKPMTDGIKSLDFSIIIPLGIGAVICVLSLSKLMDFIFRKAYSIMHHFILGVVFASTTIIIPNYNYLSLGGLVCVIVCILGVLLGLWMSKLEELKPQED